MLFRSAMPLSLRLQGRTRVLDLILPAVCTWLLLFVAWLFVSWRVCITKSILNIIVLLSTNEYPFSAVCICYSGDKSSWLFVNSLVISVCEWFSLFSLIWPFWMFLMKAMTSRNLRGKYSASIPGPLRVKPVLA